MIHRAQSMQVAVGHFQILVNLLLYQTKFTLSGCTITATDLTFLKIATLFLIFTTIILECCDLYGNDSLLYCVISYWSPVMLCTYICTISLPIKEILPFHVSFLQLFQIHKIFYIAHSTAYMLGYVCSDQYQIILLHFNKSLWCFLCYISYKCMHEW